jgi:hypothetical protein
VNIKKLKGGKKRTFYLDTEFDKWVDDLSANLNIYIKKRVQEFTSKAVSNCSHGTASQFGYAFCAADSL